MGLIVDLFAGGGGASLGIEMALGRSPDIAINHDPVALAMHKANHPDTEHLCNDIWKVDPDSVRPGEHIGLIWSSPDCTHFSIAKGGKPKDKNIRDLAWVIVDWTEKRKPDVVMVENVVEFRQWGPLYDDGTPIKELAGLHFDDWIRRFRRAGYKVDWRISRASSYRAPTIRKRICVIASRIGKPVWPKPTHGDPKTPQVQAGKLLPWKTAADDVIDWTLPCPSIFDTKEQIWEKYGLRAVRPNAYNTRARVARGIKRYVLDEAKPYIVTLTHGGRTEDATEPLRTVTAANRGEKAVVVPSLTRFNTGSTGSKADDPVPTVTANSYIKRPGGAAPLGVVAPVLAPRYLEKPGDSPRVRSVQEPAATVTAGGHAPGSLVTAVLSYAQQGGANRSIGSPAHTITASDKDQNQIISPHLMTMRNSGKPFQGAEQPTHTVTAGGAGLSCVAAHITRQFGNSVGHAADDPTGSVTAGVNKTGMVAAVLAQHNSDPRRKGGVNPGRAVHDPLSTVTATGSQQGLIAAHMMSLKGSDRRASTADEPSRTVCAGGGHSAIVSGFLAKYYGTATAQRVDEPNHTITDKARFAFTELALSAPPFGPEHEARAQEVAEFLREHGVWDGGEFVTLEIDCVTFVIVDIGLRMLTPRELFNAQGFPATYKIDRDDDGNVFTKSDQIGRAGNSVSPPWAAAHIEANCSHLMAGSVETVAA